MVEGEVSENGESRTTTRTRTIGKVKSSIVLVPRSLAVTGENRWRNEYEHENDGGEGHLFKSSIVLVVVLVLDLLVVAGERRRKNENENENEHEDDRGGRIG